MANLNQMELQNLRHFIGSAVTTNKKLADYSGKVVDEQIKQLFTKAEHDSLNTKQTLMSFFDN